MKNRTCSLLLAGLLMMACENVIDVEIQSFEEALIVEGGILYQIDESSNQHTISLKKTVDFLADNTPTPVTDATISVNDGENDYPFTHIGAGIYTAEFPTTIGSTYRLAIEYDGDVITASEVLNNVTTIDSLYTSFEEETTFTDEGYFVKIDTKDTPNERNFYHWRMFVNDALAIVPDPGNAANLIAEDEFFDGQTLIGYKPNEEIAVALGDVVRLEQWGITERYHDFLYQVYRQTGNIALVGDPPPSRIRGNLLNETTAEKYVLGYFSVASVAQSEIVVVE